MRALWSILQDMRANRLRSAITAASMVIGIIALLSTDLIGLLAHDVFVAKEEQRTARAATVRADFDDSTHTTEDAVRLWEALRARLQDGAGNPVVLWEGSGVLHTQAGEQDVSVVATLGRYSASRRLPATRGPGTGAAGPRGALLNEVAASAGLGTRHLDVPGLRPGWQLDVTGVVADAEPDARLYVPITASEADAAAVQLRAAAPYLLLTLPETKVAAGTQLIKNLATQLGVPTPPEVARYDSVPAVRSQLDTLRTLFSTVAVVALTLAALGILNIGLASVGARTRELAIRRALGARPSDLFVLVLGSALACGLIAVLTGLALSELALRSLLPRLLPPASAATIPHLPADAVVQTLAAAVLTAVLGAALPAWRASRIEIAAVLRD